MGPAPKNLLILMSDEHDPRFLGAAGHPRVKTPHLDALAARGRRFDAAYTPSPICVPARAAFATGRRVHEIRHWDNAMPYDGRHPGWGHALQAAGVPVESIGKLHYRAEEDPAGFDVEHIPMHVVGGHGMVWASIRDPYVQPGEKARGRMLGPYIGPGESTYTEYDRSVTARAVEWFGAAPEGPWVLYVGLVAPHFPLVCPPEFFDLYPPAEMPEPKLAPGSGYTPHPWVAEQGAFMDNEAHFRDAAERKAAISAYHGLVSWLDHNVGEILGALEGAGLGGATRVVYTSDHGDNVGARGLWGKSNMYEESVRVPLILAGPDVAPGVETAPVDLLDLAPTILEGAGASVPEGLPGRTLFGALDPERPIFSEYHAAGSNTAAFMLRRGRWKLVHYVGHAPELFDLAEDPEELTDLAAARPEIVAALEAELRSICDPVETDRAAKADQAALINRFGGRAAAIALGADGATPPPKG